MNVKLFQWLLFVVTKFIFFVDANWISGNLCWSMPCMNGGSCFGSAYTYLCVCPVNYSGALCEKRLETGICQENPCGNRGLCIDTGLTSFECRCYFDYMGPLCEEHVPKNNADVWSSLIPVHTRVLFDILQEAYRTKAESRSGNHFNNNQIDIPGLSTINDEPSSPSSSSSSSSTSSPVSEVITHPTETIGVEHVIPANRIQLENIFPDIGTISESNISTESSTIVETTEQSDYMDEEIFSFDITSDVIMQTTEVIPTTKLSPSTADNIITVSTEQYSSDDLNTTENQEFASTFEAHNTTLAFSSTSSEETSSNFENVTDISTMEMIQNSTEKFMFSTQDEDFVTSTSSETIGYSTDQTDNSQYTSSEQTVTSTSTSTKQTFTTEQSVETTDMSQNVQNQLLLKLCQQLITHILPNVSSSTAIEAALTLVSSSAASDKNSTEALVSWIKEQLSTSISQSSTKKTIITTTETTTATTTSTIVSSTFQTSLPSLLIKQKKLSSIPLQRVDMDDVLYQMSDNIDGEN